MGQTKGHSLTRHRVGKCYSVAVQTEPLRLVAIEFITHNRATETVGVGAVHAQLVGAAGVGIEGEETPPVSGIKHLIFRHCRLAPLVVHHLAGTIRRVEDQG